MARASVVILTASILCSSTVILALAEQRPAVGPRTITVNGQGQAVGRPDDMVLAISTETQADTAEEAAHLHASKLNSLVQALKAKLGAKAKISTADYSLYPMSVPFPPGAPVPTPEPPKTPWRFVSQITAYPEKMDEVGKLVEAGMAAGATSVAGSGFQSRVVVNGVPVPYFVQGEQPRQVPYVTLQVQTESGAPDACVVHGSEVTERVRKALEVKLGKKELVEVSQFQVNQMQDVSRLNVQPSPMRKVFVAHSSVSAETTNLDALGELVEKAVKIEGTKLDSVRFTVLDDGAIRKEALEKASHDARAKAEAVAASMGVKLKQIVSINPAGQAQPLVVYPDSGQRQSLGALQGGAVGAPGSGLTVTSLPVSPREVTFFALVTVVYEIE